MSDLGFDAELTANRINDLSVTGQLPNLNPAAEVPSGLSRPATKRRWPQGGAAAQCAGRGPQSGGQFLQADQPAADAVGRDLSELEAQAWDDFGGI
jgi:hypothetical protein